MILKQKPLKFGRFQHELIRFFREMFHIIKMTAGLAVMAGLD